MTDSAIPQYNNTETSPDIRKKSRIAALLAILFWILVMGIPLFSYTFPLPEKTGILLSFGDENGGGEQVASAKSEDNDTAEAAEGAKAEEIDSEKSKEVSATKSPETPIKVESELEADIVTAKTVKEIKTKIEKSSNEQDQRNVEAERKAQELANQQKKAAEEAEKKRKQDEAKKSFSNAFGGSGDGDNPTTQGDPKGDPTGSPLDGLISGKGNVGTGLADRGILFEPEINENSQRVGRIVVRVCVDAQGKVTEAKYTQKGSTSTDLNLIKVAEDAAKKYVFSASGLDRQCGNISIDFKLK